MTEFKYINENKMVIDKDIQMEIAHQLCRTVDILKEICGKLGK